MDSQWQTLRQELAALAEPDYQKFSASLLPGVPGILGVRLPALRKIAARMAKTGWEPWLTAFDACPDPLFEESMLAGMVIAAAPIPLAERLERIRRFVPRIENWSVCDSFCASLKEAAVFPAEYWAFLQEFFASRKEFALRFALVMATDRFVTPAYLDRVLERIDGFSHPGYYARMAAAWALSICFVKFPEEVFPRLPTSRLDDFTYNKALQKICESRQVTPETRHRIRALRRNVTK